MPTTAAVASLPPSARFAVRLGLASLCALLAVSLLALMPAVHRVIGGAAAYEVLQDSMYVLAALLVGARTFLLQRARLAWGLLSVGLSTYACGNIYYYAAVQHLDPVPFPSWSDAMWLPLYPLAYASVVLLLRRDLTRWHASMWLDGLVAALGAGAIAVVLVFGSALAPQPADPLQVMINLAYPVADLLLLALIIAMFAIKGWRASRLWWLMAAGLGLFAVADVVYLVQVAQDSFRPGTWLDDVWLVGLVAIVLAAWSSRPERVPAPIQGWALLALPMSFAATCLALILWDPLPESGVSTLAKGLAAAAIAVALVRTSLTFRELGALADARRQARTDDLTGLPNRRHFLEQLDAAVRDCPDTASVTVLLIDLDRFKEVNDGFGHHVGDELLRLAGPRLAEAMQLPATLARLGGDEFGMLLVGLPGDLAVETARRVRVVFREPFVVEGISFQVDASIGIASHPQHGSTSSTLLRHADVAMYEAKRRRLGHATFDPARDGGSRQRMETLAELRVALDDGQLVLHYQPKLDLVSGRTTSVEALVRWQHPTRGLLSPDSFLSLAEQAGLMQRIAMLVLEQALRDLRVWRSRHDLLGVAVNLSASNLQDVELPMQVSRLLNAHEVPAGALTLEITENILMVDADRAQQVLTHLQDLGVRLSVDDYGTGYSSLAYLRQLPVHELKLDRSFVACLSEDPRSAAIVHSTIGLAHTLGMRMVAEGVEDEDALCSLRAWGCDTAQGYHIARPMPADRLADWLVERAPGPKAVPASH